MEINCKHVVLHLVMHTVSSTKPGFVAAPPINVSPSRKREEPNLPPRSAIGDYRNEAILHPPFRAAESGTVYVGWEWDGT